MTDAASLLRAGDRRGAIRTLIERWRAAPSAALADLIDRLDPLDPCLPMGRSAIAEARSAGSIAGPRIPDRLSLHLGQLQQKGAVAILHAHSALEPDPRWTHVLRSWLDAPPFLSGREFWHAAFGLMGHTADPRLIARLSAGLDSMPWEVRNFIGVGTWAQALDRCQSSVDPGPPADLSTLEPLVAALERTRAAQDALRAELFERVARDPDDREARLVYADLLLQDEDPHGELIALSERTDKAAKSRSRALVKEHGLGFMGPLAPYTLQSGLALEHGIPRGARIVFKSASQVESVLDAPHWRLLRELDLDATVSWSWQDGPLPWPRVLGVAQNVEIARWADHAGTFGAICCSGSTSLREIHGRASTRYPWRAQDVSELPLKPLHLHRLVLPSTAVEAILAALDRGLTVDRLELVYRPTPGHAEQRKYGYATDAPTAGSVLAAVRRLKGKVGHIRAEVGWFDAVEDVIEAGS
ncbi:MAG: TIGR02996 domain-containing protein [Myxococcota bacterium]